ncbi:hypothetical protein [Parathalassolituus penaei]|uniref:Uncharacterized protein n=1 Tax=Parathalassolituus penaei TaxID=2997323 RepID=A0A9X3EP07_9GAMM|nr:hypothetical protein [Parathalassolituus penaei]MCY0966178.1 hypothetical protein [Parathalassolituus penaei]
MMIADLIDLEDFAQSLRELGVVIAADADAVQVRAALDSWLTTDEQSAAWHQLKARLQTEFTGRMLPDVERLLAD